MARREFPEVYDLWKKHESTYVEVFTIALGILANSTCDIDHEDKISESLCPILYKVCFIKSKESSREIRTPDWEKPIQPVADDELRGGKIRKRPDFTCKLTNPFAFDVDEYEISLHIECKRLGKPASNSWILNENYVVNGIHRFDSLEHEYGKRAFSGMMIGYIISMLPEQILIEINAYQKTLCAKGPAIEYKFTQNEVRQHLQRLNRKNIKPEVFELIHLWVDLRNLLVPTMGKS